MRFGGIFAPRNGLFFNSKFSERTYLARYPDAQHLSKYSRLLPTKLSEYRGAGSQHSGDHVLIMGNHFAHKSSDATAELFKAAFPTCQFRVMGEKKWCLEQGCGFMKAGTLDAEKKESQ